MVAGFRSHNYGRPAAAMRDCLTVLAASQYGAPKPAERPLTLNAAPGPKMLELSAELAGGAHPYNVTPEHTAQSRKSSVPASC